MKLHKVKYIIYNSAGIELQLGVIIDKISCSECREAIKTKQEWDKINRPNLIISYWIEKQ